MHVSFDEDADAADTVELHFLVLVQVPVAEARHVLAVRFQDFFVAWFAVSWDAEGSGVWA
jgi:hypothetical protein